LKRFFPPGIPIHWVVSMLQKVGALLLDQVIWNFRKKLCFHPLTITMVPVIVNRNHYYLNTSLMEELWKKKRQ
jgi:hypothetical protein